MTGVKDDKGKAPARYFYFAGLAALMDPASDKVVLMHGYEDLLKATMDKEIDTKTSCGVLLNRILASLGNSFKMPAAEILKEVSYVSQLGADKYRIFNYQQGMKWSRLMDALGRHLLHYATDDFIDEESVKDHRYHMLANLLMMAYFIKHEVGENDLEETNNEQQGVPEVKDKV